MTDNEIIKALEYCANIENCDCCKKPTPRICTTFDLQDFLDLLNRQKAEAVKEFALELKRIPRIAVYKNEIDNLLKERLGESDV